MKTFKTHIRISAFFGMFLCLTGCQKEVLVEPKANSETAETLESVEAKAAGFAGQQSDTLVAEPQLLFKSGFEKGVYFEDEMKWGFRNIKGSDPNSRFEWPPIVWGSTLNALHYINHDDEKAVWSEIQEVVGRDGKPTRALYSRQEYGITGKSVQCPYEIQPIDGSKDLYIRYWMKLDKISFSEPMKWRIIFQYKTHDWNQSGGGYRMSAYINTDAEGKPYWVLQGDRTPSDRIWVIPKKEIPVPLDEWFLTEFYWHWSEGDDGRSLWKVNGQVIADNKGPTTFNSKTIDRIMLTQIYGNANPKHQWVDDIEIWDGLKE